MPGKAKDSRWVGHALGSSCLRRRGLTDWWTTGNGQLTGIQAKIIEVQDKGYCILRDHFASPLIDACRDAFWPLLLAYLKSCGNEPNRGAHRHFLPMPFERPCFAPELFFDNEVLNIVRGVMPCRPGGVPAPHPGARCFSRP